MAKMAEERSLRQQFVAQGRIDDFKLSELPAGVRQPTGEQETASLSQVGSGNLAGMMMNINDNTSINFSPEA